MLKAEWKKTVKYATAFPDNHGAYFNDKSNYKVEEQSAEQWAMGAVEQGIRNVIDNKPYQVNAGSNPREKNAKLEVSDPERLDDGLRGIVDPDFNSSNFDPRKGLGENVDSSGGNSNSVSSTGKNASSTEDTSNLQTKNSKSDDSSKKDGLKNRDKNSEKEIENNSAYPSETESVPSIPSMQPASSAAELGPKVNTGGKVESTFFNKVLSIVG